MSLGSGESRTVEFLGLSNFAPIDAAITREQGAEYGR